MPKTIVVALDTLAVGQDISVHEGYFGQGGIVTDLDDAGSLVIRNPLGDLFRFARDGFESGFYVIEARIPFDADECVSYDTDCRGQVEMHSPGGAARSLPRCEAHAAERARLYERSMERHADSDTAPDWFDPADAGERWNDEY